MPISATPPAPAKAPAMRAVSDVVRESPSATRSISRRMVCATTTLRNIWSEGRSRPASAATTNTCHGTRAPLSVRAASKVASRAYAARAMQSSVRCPMRSPSMPKKGEKREPSQPRAAMPTSCCTEPVVERIYQPRISASISNAQEVIRSAGHWKRKLRTAKGDAICNMLRE
jgi:hypothetical protein